MIVAIETLSRVAIAECHHAQDGLVIVTFETFSRVARTGCHRTQVGSCDVTMFLKPADHVIMPWMGYNMWS